MAERTEDWKASARLLLEEVQFEHTRETGRTAGETPARRNRHWAFGNSRCLDAGIAEVVEETPDMAVCAGSGLLLDVWRGDLPEERPHTLQRVAMLCTRLWPDALAGEGMREAAARALLAHHEAQQGGAP